MESKILTNPNERPENDILENALGRNYGRFAEFVNMINAKNLVLEWHYYNDGKSWLGKVLNKKRNLCWLSVWNTGFKLTFYFTEKTISGINELEIDDEIKNNNSKNRPVGKLIPVMILISNKKRMDDALKILEYKMSIKSY